MPQRIPYSVQLFLALRADAAAVHASARSFQRCSYLARLFFDASIARVAEHRNFGCYVSWRSEREEKGGHIFTSKIGAANRYADF